MEPTNYGDFCPPLPSLPPYIFARLLTRHDRSPPQIERHLTRAVPRRAEALVRSTGERRSSQVRARGRNCRRLWHGICPIIQINWFYARKSSFMSVKPVLRCVKLVLRLIIQFKLENIQKTVLSHDKLALHT